MIVAFMQSSLGLLFLLGLAWAVSENRRAVPWRLVGLCLAVQVALALIILRIRLVWQAVAALGAPVAALERASRAGSSYIFGYLGGAPVPFDVKQGVSALVIAFDILPIVIVTTAVAALLWHWRVLPLIVTGLSKALSKSLGIGGAPALGVASTFFFGVVEAPPFIRAYLTRMSRAELFLIMTAGLATISGVVLVLYANLLADTFPSPVGHLITASLMSLPAAVALAQILVPGPLQTDDTGGETLTYAGSIDAVIQGSVDGLKLFWAIIAILIVIFALVHLSDQILAFLPQVGGQPVTVARLFGWVFTPLVLLFGIPWSEAAAAGELMGIKAILNEFVAYQAFGAADLSPRSQLIMAYALCGFANLASIGMLTATLAALAPGRRAEIAGLGVKAWVAGNLATGMTGTVAGLTSWP